MERKERRQTCGKRATSPDSRRWMVYRVVLPLDAREIWAKIRRRGGGLGEEEKRKGEEKWKREGA